LPFFPPLLITIHKLKHNIVAFNQFTNIVRLLAIDEIDGTSTIADPIKYGFASIYAQVATKEEKLNVVRELFHLTVPNSGSFSLLKEYNNPGLQPVQSVHVHQLIMMSNTAYLAVASSTMPLTLVNGAHTSSMTPASMPTSLPPLTRLPVPLVPPLLMAAALILLYL